MSTTEQPVTIEARRRGLVTVCLMSATLMQALDQPWRTIVVCFIKLIG